MDDGAQSEDESLEMARMATNQGMVAVFATPHIVRGSYDTEPSTIRQATERLAECARNAGLPLLLYPGAENHPAPDLVENCRLGKVMTLGGSKYVLVEAPGAELPWSFEKILFNLMVGGFHPVLAHPERNPTLNRDSPRLLSIFRTGVILQVNARSLTGFYGSRVQASAERIVRECLAGLIGSDAHQPRDYEGLRRVRDHVRALGGDRAVAAIVQNEEALMEAVSEAAARFTGLPSPRR
ncbi:MAG: CpsB/CapC family capsule biosynthesis tyrosine phosphatase [Bacillota bacterium]|nr:CpsB/CapC family capsule biosynthesis tyrosine phosphatase [Bacillota bacterium]